MKKCKSISKNQIKLTSLSQFIMNNKIKKIITYLIIILCIFSAEKVLAATSGIGVKITITNVSGSVVEQATVLRKSDSDFSGSYKIWSSLPSFNNENASEVLGEWTANETNVSNLMKAAGFSTTVAKAKANNYTMIINGVYKESTLEYRKLVANDSSECAVWETTTETYQVCNRCRPAGCERYGTRYCALYNENCYYCGGETKTREIKKCYTNWSSTKPTLKSGETLYQRGSVGFTYKQATTVDFERTKIEQATKCGETSTYRDGATIEKAVGNAKYLDNSLGNSKYCPVYCIEENVFTFPGFKPDVDSGSHFTWTIGETNEKNIIDGLTVKLSGTRNCRTKINLDKWNEDYNDLIKKIEDEINKLTATPYKETLCNSGITNSNSAASAGGYHLVAELNYITDDYTLSYTREHVASNDQETNYYLHKFQQYPEPKSFTGSNGKTYYVMKYQIWEANPDTCYPASSSTMESDWYDTAEEAKSALEGQAGTKCGQGFDSEYADNSVSLSNCSKEEAVSGRHLECHTEYQHNVCIDLDANGDCIYGDSTSNVCEWVDDYKYKYSGTLTVRRCSFSGTSVTKSDLQTPCRETGLYTCPTGYYFYDKSTCYKTDTSYLKKLLKQQQDMIDILRECSTITFDYELDTSMSVDYEEPVYHRIIELETEKISSTSKENHKVSAGNKQVKYYVCDLDSAQKKCWLDSTKGEISSIWISEYGKQFDVEYQYTLPKEMYQYVLLPSGKSVDIIPSNYGSATTGFQNYLNIGYSNYPVHYTTSRGTYNLDIVYSNVGYSNHFTPIIRAYEPSTIDTSGNVVYDCEYDVNTGQPFCPEGGCIPNCIGVNCGETDTNSIKLIYRPISLTTPFPGTDGSGREAGANWNNTQLISKYILNNRNTVGNTIYSQREPMYEITLNPSRIQEIRQYNSKTTYDDFNLKCVKGYECKSEFIRESTVGFASYFSGCGIGNWNACDKQDGFTR